MASKKITSGIIKTDGIQETHEKIKKLVERYHDINAEVSEITTTVKENWIGKGLNAFELQYNLLINKIDDFGDVLSDIYDALVKAQGEYDTADESTRQQFDMANQTGKS